MAGESDVEIVVNERVEGDAIENVAKATQDAAKNAKELIKLIDSLSQTLEGINGDAAGQLRNELNELADIIKSMDLSKLQSLEGILEKIKVTKVKLTPDGIEKVGEKLDEVAEKSQKAKKQLEEIGINISVEDSGDADETMKRKFVALADAGSVVESIKQYRDALTKIPGSYDDIIHKLNILEIEARNAGPDTMETFKIATDEVTKAFEKLGSAGKSAVSGIQKILDNTSKSLQENIQNPLKDIAGTSTESFSGANAMTSILNGNFQSLGSQMMGLLKKTKMWGSAVNGVGGSAKLVGGAFAFAMYGINKGIEATQRLLAGLREEARREEQWHWDNQYSAGQGADTTMKTLRLSRDAASNFKTVRDAKKDSRRSARDAALDAGDARLEAYKQRALAGNFNDGDVERINREFEDTMTDRGFNRQQNAITDKMEDLSNKRSDIEKDLKNLKKAQKDMRSHADSASKALQRAIENGEKLDSYGSNVWQNICDMVGGRSQEEVMADAIKYIEQGQSLDKMIQDYQEQLRKDIDAREAELEAVGHEIAGASSSQMALNEKRKAEAEKRAARDKRIRHEIDMENRAKKREDDVWSRNMDDNDEERDYQRKAEKSGYTEKLDAARKRVESRKSEYDSVMKEYNALIKKNAGKDERDWNDDDKTRRSELEQDMDRALSRLTGAEDEAYRLERDGGSAEYGRRRELEVEKREDFEADRQQKRAWKTKRLGAAGMEVDAKEELDYQQKLYAERKKKLDDFVAKQKQANGGKFSIEAMTDQQRAEFQNLRADVRESKGNVRSAKGDYMDRLWEGNQRAVDFRNGLKESNRLTSMGLAGGGTMKWGVDTASNTKEMVRLQRELNTRLAKERNDLSPTSATYGY